MIIFITVLIGTDAEFLHSSIRQLPNSQIDCYKQKYHLIQIATPFHLPEKWCRHRMQQIIKSKGWLRNENF